MVIIMSLANRQQEYIMEKIKSNIEKKKEFRRGNYVKGLNIFTFDTQNKKISNR